MWNIFKKKRKDPPFNVHHPDIAPNVEVAFEVRGRKYYRFKASEEDGTAEFKMPMGRYKWYDATFHEAELRMRLPILNSYLDELEKSLEIKGNNIQLGKAFQIIYAMRTRTTLAFEPETIKRLAAVSYFDETEDLTDFNEEYGKKKVEFWERNDFYGFFLTRPIDELCSLKGFSEMSLKTYLQAVDVILQDLTYEPKTAS